MEKPPSQPQKSTYENPVVGKFEVIELKSLTISDSARRPGFYSYGEW